MESGRKFDSYACLGSEIKIRETFLGPTFLLNRGELILREITQKLYMVHSLPNFYRDSSIHVHLLVTRKVIGISFLLSPRYFKSCLSLLGFFSKDGGEDFPYFLCGIFFFLSQIFVLYFIVIEFTFFSVFFFFPAFGLQIIISSEIREVKILKPICPSCIVYGFPSSALAVPLLNRS